MKNGAALARKKIGIPLLWAHTSATAKGKI